MEPSNQWKFTPLLPPYNEPSSEDHSRSSGTTCHLLLTGAKGGWINLLLEPLDQLLTDLHRLPGAAGSAASSLDFIIQVDAPSPAPCSSPERHLALHKVTPVQTVLCRSQMVEQTSKHYLSGNITIYLQEPLKDHPPPGAPPLLTCSSKPKNIQTNKQKDLPAFQTHCGLLLLCEH